MALWSGDLEYRASARLEDVSGSLLATIYIFDIVTRNKDWKIIIFSIAPTGNQLRLRPFRALWIWVVL